MTDLLAPAHAAVKVCIDPDCASGGQPLPVSAFHHRPRRNGPRAPAGRCRKCCRRRESERRDELRATGLAVDREPSGRVPVGPLRDWLERQIRRLDCTEKEADEAMGRMLGVSAKTVERWRSPDGKHALVDTIDRAFCRWGDPFLLRELYPELYDLPPCPPEQTTAPRSSRERLEWIRSMYADGLNSRQILGRLRRDAGLQVSGWDVQIMLSEPVPTADPRTVERYRRAVRLLAA